MNLLPKSLLPNWQPGLVYPTGDGRFVKYAESSNGMLMAIEVPSQPAPISTIPNGNRYDAKITMSPSPFGGTHYRYNFQNM